MGSSHTKVTYDGQGRGTGRVGELTVQYSVSQIAEGQFTATAIVPSLLWSATDGNLTLHRDGTLEVQYPSNGIVEYWRRVGSTGKHAALPCRPGPSSWSSVTLGRAVHSAAARTSAGTGAWPSATRTPATRLPARW